MLPAKPPVRSITPWLFITLIVFAAAVCWWLHIIVAALIFTVFIALIVTAFIVAPFARRRQQEEAAKLPRDASCTFARSFDFRHTESLVMRAVFEELQPFVKIPILASHRLVEDLKIDDEDLSFDFAPVIAQRLGRTLHDPEKNPYYGRVQTVEDLVHFMEAQPSEKAEKT